MMQMFHSHQNMTNSAAARPVAVSSCRNAVCNNIAVILDTAVVVSIIICALLLGVILLGRISLLAILALLGILILHKPVSSFKRSLF